MCCENVTVLGNTRVCTLRRSPNYACRSDFGASVTKGTNNWRHKILNIWYIYSQHQTNQYSPNYQHLTNVWTPNTHVNVRPTINRSRSHVSPIVCTRTKWRMHSNWHVWPHTALRRVLAMANRYVMGHRLTDPIPVSVICQAHECTAQTSRLKHRRSW
jgi:hypothetical protein